jgi:hypothetical protein
MIAGYAYVGDKKNGRKLREEYYATEAPFFNAITLRASPADLDQGYWQRLCFCTRRTLGNR